MYFIKLSSLFLTLYSIILLFIKYSSSVPIPQENSLDYSDFNDLFLSLYQTEDSQFPQCVPVEKLQEGKFRPGTSDNDPIMPEWFNRDIALRGKEFARNHFFHIFYTLGLGMILQASSLDSLRRVFFYTNKTTTPEKATKRFVANFLQMKVWYDSPGLEEDADFFDSLATVRGIHQSVAFKVGRDKKVNLEVPSMTPPPNYKESRMWRAFKMDIERSGLAERYPLAKYNTNPEPQDKKKVKFNQFDMSGGLWTFMCLPMIMPDKLDINTSEDDLFAFFHLWAGIGWLLGIEDEYNVALHKNYEEGREYCTRMYAETIIPNLINIDFEGQYAVEQAIHGIMGIIPALYTRENFLVKVLEDLVRVDAPNLRRELAWGGRVAAPMEALLIRPLLRSPWGKQIMNYYMRMWLRVASLKYFGFDGNNLTQVAQHGFFY